MKKLILTGGGTAGHVTPNIAMLPRLKELEYTITYVGSVSGMEQKLIADFDIPYFGIPVGKLRRYLSIDNLKDTLNVVKGLHEARKLLKQLKPDIIFSKGGFVAVPVVLAAGFLKIPVVIHECDLTPGLANKLCIPTVKKVCCNFPETMQYIPAEKAVLTGTPIRQELLNGDPEKARTLCGFDNSKPVLLVVGGSLGASAINGVIRENLTELLNDFQIIHLCGKGKEEPSLEGTKGYAQFGFVKAELADMFALADVVVSRAGANSICELCALAKPNLLIPLPAAQSRGDQLLNAESFRKQGFSLVIQEEELTLDSLKAALTELLTNKDKYISAMHASAGKNGVKAVTDVIEEVYQQYCTKSRDD